METVDLFIFRITSVMTGEQLFIAEPEFLNNQQVMEVDDTVDSGDNIASYCACERQAGSSDDIDDFNTVQCNLTESTQYCSGSFSVINVIIVYQRFKLQHIITITRATAVSCT
jgi:hypothetical protein